jgi:hypothetical protein
MSPLWSAVFSSPTLMTAESAVAAHTPGVVSLSMLAVVPVEIVMS